MGTTTKLRFTQPRIYKAINEIKAYAEKSKNIKGKNIKTEEGLYSVSFDKVEDISLILPLKERLNGKLDELFEQDGTYSYRDYIRLFWQAYPRNKRYWDLEIGGRPLCDSRVADIIERTATYDSCPCPSEFKETCNDLIEILKQYALPDR